MFVSWSNIIASWSFYCSFEFINLWVYIVIFVIIGVTILTYLLTVYGLKHVSPSVSSAYIYLQPVLVMLFAFVFSAMGLTEDYTGSITLEKIAYMLLIFGGVYITSSNSFLKKARHHAKNV